MGTLSTLWNLVVVAFIGPPLTEGQKVCAALEMRFGLGLRRELPPRKWAQNLQKLHALKDAIISCAALRYLSTGTGLLGQSNDRLLRYYCDLEFKREPVRGGIKRLIGLERRSTKHRHRTKVKALYEAGALGAWDWGFWEVMRLLLVKAGEPDLPWSVWEQEGIGGPEIEEGGRLLEDRTVACLDDLSTTACATWLILWWLGRRIAYVPPSGVRTLKLALLDLYRLIGERHGDPSSGRAGG